MTEHKLVPAYHGGANFQLIADWLTDLDSHGIYDARMVITDAPGLGLSAKMQDDGMIIVRDPRTGHEARIWSQTAEATRTAIEQRGLGGYFDPKDAERFVTGWVVAEQLALGLTGGEKGLLPKLQGRGSRFREAIRILREHGRV
jgi:hypothetical protein